MVSASKDMLCDKRGSEDPTVGVLLSPSAFRRGSVNLEAKTAKEVVYGIELYFTSRSLIN